MARRKHHGVIKKASEFTEAKRGYFVFTGSYPNMKVKHFRSKKAAMEHKRGKKV